LHRLDTADKLDGSKKFVIDLQLPGMLMPRSSSARCSAASSSASMPPPSPVGARERRGQGGRRRSGRYRRHLEIDDGFEPKLITTLRGAGYRFGS